jgi:glycerol uptake facilitator-like aquaporin
MIWSKESAARSTIPLAPMTGTAPTTTSDPTITVPMRSRLLAEFLGSALLVIAVVGSGIMAETLSPTDVGLQLFENAAATAGALIALIATFATVSGAHFNPAVTLVERLMGTLDTRTLGLYAFSQIAGGFVGVVLANLMFGDETGLGAISISQHERSTTPALLAEVIATVGLLLVIHGSTRHARPYVVAVMVGVWIGGAYFFTASTSFANPMVTFARMFSDTFAGIAPSSAPAFMAAQLIGVAIAVVLIRELFHRGSVRIEQAERNATEPMT